MKPVGLAGPQPSGCRIRACPGRFYYTSVAGTPCSWEAAQTPGLPRAGAWAAPGALAAPLNHSLFLKSVVIFGANQTMLSPAQNFQIKVPSLCYRMSRACWTHCTLPALRPGNLSSLPTLLPTQHPRHRALPPPCQHRLPWAWHSPKKITHLPPSSFTHIREPPWTCQPKLHGLAPDPASHAYTLSYLRAVLVAPSIARELGGCTTERGTV